MSSVQDSWRRIEDWLAHNAPTDTQFLAAGASESQIEEAEKVLGARLPNDFCQSYLLHNGAPFYGSLRVFEYGEFLSWERMIHDWSIWKELWDDDEEFRGYDSDPDPGIKNSWWRHGWIPFLSDGCGNSLCVDLDPDEGGTLGQVFELNHDSSDRPLFAPSFAAWLSAYADSLDAGELGFDGVLGIQPIHLLD